MLLASLILSILLTHIVLLSFPMDLPLDLSFSFKLHYNFTVTLSLPFPTYCFCLGILLTLSSKLLIIHCYRWPIRGVATSSSTAFEANLHVISPTNRLHHLVAIPLHRALYLRSWLAIMVLLSLGYLSLMLFVQTTIVPWLLIISFILHPLSTGILIGKNLIPSVTKFWIFSDDNPLSGFYDCFHDVLYPI